MLARRTVVEATSSYAQTCPLLEGCPRICAFPPPFKRHDMVCQRSEIMHKDIRGFFLSSRMAAPLAWRPNRNRLSTRNSVQFRTSCLNSLSASLWDTHVVIHGVMGQSQLPFGSMAFWNAKAALLRIYSQQTASQLPFGSMAFWNIAANYAIDKARFKSQLPFGRMAFWNSTHTAHSKTLARRTVVGARSSYAQASPPPSKRR